DPRRLLQSRLVQSRCDVPCRPFLERRGKDSSSSCPRSAREVSRYRLTVCRPTLPFSVRRLVFSVQGLIFVSFVSGLASVSYQDVLLRIRFLIGAVNSNAEP